MQPSILHQAEPALPRARPAWALRPRGLAAEVDQRSCHAAPAGQRPGGTERDLLSAALPRFAGRLALAQPGEFIGLGRVLPEGVIDKGSGWGCPAGSSGVGKVLRASAVASLQLAPAWLAWQGRGISSRCAGWAAARACMPGARAYKPAARLAQCGGCGDGDTSAAPWGVGAWAALGGAGNVGMAWWPQRVRGWWGRGCTFAHQPLHAAAHMALLAQTLAECLGYVIERAVAGQVGQRSALQRCRKPVVGVPMSLAKQPTFSGTGLSGIEYEREVGGHPVRNAHGQVCRDKARSD